MRRGLLRLHSSSALRRGRVSVHYLRELLLVSVIMALILMLLQSLHTNATTTVEHPHSDHPVYAMALSRGGSALWVSRESYGLSEVNLLEGIESEHSRLCHAEASYTAHGGSDRPLTIRFGFDKSLELLHGNEAIHSEILPDPFLNVTESDVSVDGKTAMIITGDGLAKIWHESPDGSFASRELKIPIAVDYAILSRDGSRLIIVNPESVTWWDLQNDREVNRWDTTHESKMNAARCGRPEVIALSADQTHLALGFNDGLVRIWECATRRLVWETKSDPYRMSAIAFSPSGLLAAAGFDETVRLWDWQSNTLKWKRSHHTQPVHNLVFTADESQLYSGGLDGRVVEVSTLTGDLLRTLP